MVVTARLCRRHHVRALLLAVIRIRDRWPIPQRIVRIGLFGAAIAIVALLWKIWSVTTSTPTGLCAVLNGSPFTTFSYPSQVFVFTAILAYVAGHLTSRYVVEVRPELIALLGEERFERIGPVLVVKLFATGSLLIATILNVYEARAFTTGTWPITYFVWCATAASPLLALLGAATFSFLIGRWLWIPR